MSNERRIMENKPKIKFLYLSVNILGTLYYMTLAKIFWFLPLRIFFTEFYEEYFNYPSVLFWLTTGWLVWGAAKISQLEWYHNRYKGSFGHKSLKNFFKKIIIVPFMPFININYKSLLKERVVNLENN